MSEVTAFLLEIAKLTIPGLIVYLVVRRMLEQHFENQQRIRHMESVQNNKNVSQPLRLQAYERMALFCERISIPNLVLRMRSGQHTVKDMKMALMYALQQEYEHNVTQQVYLSDQLWKIINLAKDQTAYIIDKVAENHQPEDAPQAFIQELLQENEQSEAPPLTQALAAIRKEVSTHL